MKNIFKINLLLLTFIFTSGTLISTSSHAMGKKRFDAIVASHKSHMKGLGENTKKYTYFQIDQLDRKVKRDKNSFLVVSGKVLEEWYFGYSETAEKLNTFIENHPDAAVVADYQNDGCTYVDTNIPKNIKTLNLSNVKGDIKNLDITFDNESNTKNLRFINFHSLKDLDICTMHCGSKQLVNLDLSSLKNLKMINLDEIVNTYPKLEILNLKNLQRATTFNDCDEDLSSNLNTILVNGETNPKLVHDLSNMLLKSKNTRLKKLGRKLKKDYSRIVPNDIEALLAKLNLDKINSMTPKPLKDIKEIKDGDVPTAFNDIYTNVLSLISDPDIPGYFNDDFLPMLRYYFGVDLTITPIWEIEDETVNEFKISIKHLLKAFKDLLSTHKKNAVASYLTVLLLGFEECQTRQVGELNQILAALGVRERQLDGLEGDIWNWVNDFKMDAYYVYLKDHPADSEQNSHHYSEQWSAINKIVKLPTAIRKHNNKFYKLTKLEKKQLGYAFLRECFTPTSISDKIYKELTSKKSSYSPMDVRTLIANMEGTATMTTFAKHKKGYDAYFKPLAGKAAPKNFAWETSPITKGEVNRLLVLLRVFNK